MKILYWTHARERELLIWLVGENTECTESYIKALSYIELEVYIGPWYNRKWVTNAILALLSMVERIPGQFPSLTVPIPDNSHQVDSSHPGQFPSRTVPIPDNSHRTIPIPDISHPGQFPPDNSHPGHFPSRTITTGQFPSRTVPIPDNSNPLNSQHYSTYFA